MKESAFFPPGTLLTCYAELLINLIMLCFWPFRCYSAKSSIRVAVDCVSFWKVVFPDL